MDLLHGRVEHEAAMTMEACTAIDRALETNMRKNPMLCNRRCTDFYRRGGLLYFPGFPAVSAPSPVRL